MKALNLIIRREYLTRIKKKSFIILTLLMPVLFASSMFVPFLLSEIKDLETKKIVVIDRTGKYISHIESSSQYQFVNEDDDPGLDKSAIGGDIFGVLQIANDLNLVPEAVTLVTEKQAPKDLTDYINRVLSEVVKDDKLTNIARSNQLDPEIVLDIEQILKDSDRINVSTIRIDENGAEKEMSASVSSVIAMIFTFLMYAFILMYGTMVMNGVVEEKSNRIVEVMISSVRPFDLMMGKIIGIGLTGLTQLFIWIVLALAVFGLKDIAIPDTSPTEFGSLSAGISALSLVNWVEILTYFILLFIGGYLIYASIFAMFGASVDNPQDTQQFVMPITLLFFFAFYAGIYSVQNPDGPLAFWCSMIPFTSPIVMMVRIPFEIPLWEKLLSLAILYATIFFVVKFAAKIYRVGILMYGKKPSIKEIIKWMSYK